MKKKLLLYSIAACFSGIVLSSYEHGPAYEGGLNRTGSAGSAASCNGSGCHGSNASTTIVSITVSSGGVPVTQYVPGTTYDVAIRGHNTAAGVSSKEFGFQVSATLSNDAQAGTFAVTSSKHRVTPLSGLQIVEHKKANSDSATNYFVAKFTWTAPVAGSGNVTFYGILNSLDGGVDGDDDDDDDDDDDKSTSTGKDYPNPATPVVLTEKGGSNPTTAISYVAAAQELALFPNPCSNELTIDMKGAYTVRVFTSAGATVYSMPVISGGAHHINMQNMRMGIYFAEIIQDGNRIVKTFIKQ